MVPFIQLVNISFCSPPCYLYISHLMSLQASSPASQDTANFQAMSGTTENRPTDKSEAMDE